jgi:hypothetical protein
MFIEFTVFYSKFLNIKNIDTNLPEMLFESITYNGLYMITTTISVSGSPIPSGNVTEEYFTGDGCPITVINYC